MQSPALAISVAVSAVSLALADDRDTRGLAAADLNRRWWRQTVSSRDEDATTYLPGEPGNAADDSIRASGKIEDEATVPPSGGTTYDSCSASFDDAGLWRASKGIAADHELADESPSPNWSNQARVSGAAPSHQGGRSKEREGHYRHASRVQNHDSPTPGSGRGHAHRHNAVSAARRAEKDG